MTEMTESPNVTDQLADQLWQAIADTRDAYPREKNDAPTDEVVAAVLPVVAAELRRIAAPHAPHVATGSVDYDCGYALACDAWAKALRARADELDPPAGTRED